MQHSLDDPSPVQAAIIRHVLDRNPVVPLRVCYCSGSLPPKSAFICLDISVEFLLLRCIDRRRASPLRNPLFLPAASVTSRQALQLYGTLLACQQVLHAGRIKGPKAGEPRAQQLLGAWRGAKTFYATPFGSNDDWCAAVVSCP